MADELLDLVDSDDNIIGNVWKSKAHGDPNLIHREVAIAVFNDNGEILLQQRSLNKVTGPGMWDISAVGHPLAKENPKFAVYRELKEELGIDVKPIYFDKLFSTHNKTGENQESRFTWVYYAITNGYPKIKLQASEVNDAKWIKFSEIEIFSRTHDFRLDRELIKQTYRIARNLKII